MKPSHRAQTGLWLPQYSGNLPQGLLDLSSLTLPGLKDNQKSQPVNKMDMALPLEMYSSEGAAGLSPSHRQTFLNVLKGCYENIC